ncbi:type II toxin-antitoxin system RelE/ParE family toxin [Candidatus Thiosymbion oneisti]|uniref:type II toxin-antitoxin system RelE/ParE family toxin n=1 Tax=Candidatus Thiosymbion oneisti TaxID=589554 RepID=UPI000ABFCEAE|nr:type II toxin-antitoxin system RelE/ParE family toxin [Candidatus Thiosymbion oneisti]
MRVIFSKYAKLELEDAACFYELKFGGLGRKFEEEVKKAVKRISEYPKAWSTERDDIRKYLLHKFPYKLLYSIEADHIFIIAVSHQHRKPDYWIDRERYNKPV